MIAAIAAGAGVLLLLAVEGSAQSPLQPPPFTVLHSFTGPPSDGRNPITGLVMDASGNLYGTTLIGGADNAGTAFVMRTDGSEAILYSFPFGPNGGPGPSGLTLGAGGNFYGTTEGGGTHGTVFEMDPGGNFTLLYSLAGPPSDGAAPMSGVIRDAEGDLYGTTVFGGSYQCSGGGCGTVFRLSPDGTETVLHNFAGAPNDGAAPQGGLLLDSAGNLYGTTCYGGTSNNGTVFKLSADGTETVLYSFAGPANNGGSSTGPPGDGACPAAGLILDSAGNLYGTTANGGAYSGGTLFKLSPAGVETVLRSFGSPSSLEGSPSSGVVMDPAGNLYGTTNRSVYELSPDGTFTVLHSFDGSEGWSSDGGLILDGMRNLYGTTRGETASPCSVEGPGGCGIVFKLRTPTSDLSINTAAPTVVPSGATITYAIAVMNHGPDAARNVTISEVIPAGATFSSVSINRGSCTAPQPAGQGR